MRANVFFRLVAIFAFSFASMMLAQTAETSPNSATSKDYSFTIKADRGWTDTGLNLNPGDRVHISGAVIDCGGPAPLDKAHLPLPSAPAGALLVKLQAEEPPVVASTDADLPIVDPSHLYLGVNGWQCQGTVPVKVHVERHKTPPRG
jgi:hypothetical protein